MNGPPTRRVVVWLAAALAASTLLTAVVFLDIAVANGVTRERIVRALAQLAPARARSLLELSGTDSWKPMLLAYNRNFDDQDSDLYSVFFSDGIKFQYPPSSLLLFDLFPRSMTRMVGDTISTPLRYRLTWLSRIAIILTVMICVLILEQGLRRITAGRPAPRSEAAARIGLSLLLGLTYFPLLIAHGGQIQVFLSALLTLAMLFYLLGWRVPAGICVGVASLSKPHYGLVLLWSVLRRQRGFTLGLAGAVLAGLALSVARFGLTAHLRYLDLLRKMATGEPTWPNQSVNGLLNRFFQNGDPLRFVQAQFAPYHPVIYTITILSSVALLAVALWPGRGDRATDQPIDLMVILAAVTMASPIAWIPHYGPFLAIFAAVLPRLLYVLPLGRLTVPLFALSYVTIANHLVRPDVLFRNRWLGLLGSHVFFGGLLLVGLLLALRAEGRDDPNTTPDRLALTTFAPRSPQEQSEVLPAR